MTTTPTTDPAPARDLWTHPTGAAAVDAADLYGLLTDLALSADTDDTALMLHGVLLHTDTTSAGETVLVGTSTDRIILGQAHIPIRDGGALLETFVPLGGVRVLIAALDAAWTATPDDEDEYGQPLPDRPAGPPTGATIYLRRDGSALTATALGTMAIQVDTPPGGWPSSYLSRVAVESTGETATIAPHLWQRLATIADRRDTGITVTTQAPPRQPVRVHIGAQYRALVMPMVGHDIAAQPPMFLPPSSTAPSQTQELYETVSTTAAASDGRA